MAAAEAFAFAASQQNTYQTGELRPVRLDGSMALVDQLRNRQRRITRDDEDLLLLWST